jgi:predicted PurR-regulated permease PerM
MSFRDSAPAGPSQLRVVLQVLLVVGAVIVALWALHRIAAVVLVLIAAALFAYVIAPLVELAEQPIRLAGRARRLPRAAAIALVYALLAVGVGVVAVLVLPSATQQAGEAVARIPTYAQSLITWERSWTRRAPADAARVATVDQ